MLISSKKPLQEYRIMFDHISGHHSPAKMTHKINHHTIQNFNNQEGKVEMDDGYRRPKVIHPERQMHQLVVLLKLEVSRRIIKVEKNAKATF